MLANPQQIREITCPEKHSLIQTDDLCQLYEGQSYTENKYFCDTCRNECNTKSSPASHCKTCGFDLCPNCYESQKLIQIDCPQNQSHVLLKVRALQEFSNYASNSYGCHSCGGIFDSSIFPSAHCRACGYDLCPDCFGHIQLHILDPQQSQINFQPPQINIEQSQPQSQPEIVSHAPPQEEQPKKWINLTFPKFIACPNGHELQRENELKRLGFPSGGIMVNHSYICRTCNATGLLAVQDKYSCKTCSFDMCPHCYENQKKVEKILCPKSHGLMVVRTLKEFAKYGSNNYRCGFCPAKLDSIRHPSAHCLTCNSDLCPNCVIKNKSQEKKNNGTLKQVTCPSRHNLTPVNNLAQLYPDANTGGIYFHGMYNCDTCPVTYNCEADPSHHCPTCQFDICPSCYGKDQEISFECQRNHPLYIVSNLKANHEASGSYADNTYVCETCRGSWDAAFHPSCHCAQCKFDLCPTCFEARNVQKGGGNPPFLGPIFINTTKPENKQINQTQTRTGLLIQGQQNISQLPPQRPQFICGGVIQGQQNTNQLPPQQTQPRCGGVIQGQQNYNPSPQQQPQPRLDFFTGKPLGQFPLQKPGETQTQPRFDIFPKMPLQQGQQNSDQLPPQQTQPRLDFFTGMPLGQFPLPKIGETQTQPRLDFFTGKPLGQTLFPKPEESKSNHNQMGSEKKELSDEILCVVCFNERRSYLFNPCNHLCACEKCTFDLVSKKSGCPICRNPIQGFTKVFMS